MLVDLHRKGHRHFALDTQSQYLTSINLCKRAVRGLSSPFVLTMQLSTGPPQLAVTVSDMDLGLETRNGGR